VSAPAPGPDPGHTRPQRKGSTGAPRSALVLLLLAVMVGTAALTLALSRTSPEAAPAPVVAAPAAPVAAAAPAVVTPPEADSAASAALAGTPAAPEAPTASPPATAQRPAPARPRPNNNAAKDRGAQPAPAAAPAPPVTGSVQLAISPWGQVEVNGQPAGTAPPLTRLTLNEGTHSITVRNEDFPPHTVTVQVLADKPVVVRHRFGQ
jgi:serine/threonine-protein kinase